MKNNLFICNFYTYTDIIILFYINPQNEVYNFSIGRLLQSSEDGARIDMDNGSHIYATFKRLATSEYIVEVNNRDFKKMDQEQINQIYNLLQEEILFKDLTKIIDISKDHKYIQEYNLLEYLIEYKRIKKMSQLSDEKVMLESIISNIVLLIDALKKSEYSKTNYNNDSKNTILLNVQKWFNNYKSVDELYNLNIKLKEFEAFTSQTDIDNNIGNILKTIISSLEKIIQTNEGLIQLKLQRHKIIIDRINTILTQSTGQKEEYKSKITSLIQKI